MACIGRIRKSCRFHKHDYRNGTTMFTISLVSSLLISPTPTNMFEFTDDILMDATEFLLQHPDLVDLIDDSSIPDTYIHPPKATRKRGKNRFSTA